MTFREVSGSTPDSGQDNNNRQGKDMDIIYIIIIGVLGWLFVNALIITALVISRTKPCVCTYYDDDLLDCDEDCCS